MRRSWASAVGSAPNDADLLALSRLSYVVVLDVETNGTDEREAL
jgi:hypothetical protein